MAETPSPLTPKFVEAFAYALELHGTQKRKRGESDVYLPAIPYMAHLMAVAALVLEHGGDEEEAIAALLHDGPEDRGGLKTLEEIRRRFGGRVAKFVEACTDTFETPKPEWWARKRQYHQKLRAASPSALLVSAADKVHNAETTLRDVQALGAEAWTRFDQGRNGSLWNYACLLEIYREQLSGDTTGLTDRLELALDGLFENEEEKVTARFFDPSSLMPSEEPALHIVMGGVCTGKSRFIRERFSAGAVHVDAPRVFLGLCRGEVLPFPGDLEEKLERIGRTIAQRAVEERRSIVVEVIGQDKRLEEVAGALKACRYRVKLEALVCDLDTALARNEARGENNISAHYAEPFHYDWLTAAARSVN